MNRSELRARRGVAMLPTVLLTLGSAAGMARAELLSLQPRATEPSSASQPAPASDASMRLDQSAGMSSQVEREKAAEEQKRARSTDYGLAGSRWWTVGGLYANNFDEANDFNVHGAFSQFLADDFEFVIEAAGWYFNQPGTDTGGVSGSFLLRWHFAHDPEYDWTVFVDAGIGLLAAFDSVPDGGTSFNLLPRAGLGFTKALTEDRSGPRLMIGARWHHISNARIYGDDRNPARDSLAGYVAITFPF